MHFSGLQKNEVNPLKKLGRAQTRTPAQTEQSFLAAAPRP
jgi:hypothetical protein